MTSNSYFPYFDQDFSRGNPGKKDTLFGFEREAYLMTLLVDKNQQIRGSILRTILVRSEELPRKSVC